MSKKRQLSYLMVLMKKAQQNNRISQISVRAILWTLILIIGIKKKKKFRKAFGLFVF